MILERKLGVCTPENGDYLHSICYCGENFWVLFILVRFARGTHYYINCRCLITVLCTICFCFHFGCRKAYLPTLKNSHLQIKVRALREEICDSIE
jgi:hypothetical protein